MSCMSFTMVCQHTSTEWFTKREIAVKYRYQDMCKQLLLKLSKVSKECTQTTMKLWQCWSLWHSRKVFPSLLSFLVLSYPDSWNFPIGKFLTRCILLSVMHCNLGQKPVIPGLSPLCVNPSNSPFLKMQLFSYARFGFLSFSSINSSDEFLLHYLILYWNAMGVGGTVSIK